MSETFLFVVFVTCACEFVDGDLISVVDSSDLSFAIQNCRGVLHLTLFGKPQHSSAVYDTIL